MRDNKTETENLTDDELEKLLEKLNQLVKNPTTLSNLFSEDEVSTLIMCVNEEIMHNHGIVYRANFIQDDGFNTHSYIQIAVFNKSAQRELKEFTFNGVEHNLDFEEVAHDRVAQENNSSRQNRLKRRVHGTIARQTEDPTHRPRLGLFIGGTGVAIPNDLQDSELNA